MLYKYTSKRCKISAINTKLRKMYQWLPMLGLFVIELMYTNIRKCKQQFSISCFNWMIPNLHMRNGCFTKHPLEFGGCLGYQLAIYIYMYTYYISSIMVQWYYPIPVSPISQKRCNFWSLFMLEIPHLQNNLQTTVSCNMAPLPRLGSSDQIWNHIVITTGWKNKSPRNRFYSPLITPQNGRIPYKINWSKVCSGSFGCGPRPMLGMCLE